MLHTTMFLCYAWNRFGTYFNLLVWIGALESCGTRERLVFRDIYEGGLWDDGGHVCTLTSPLPWS